MPVRVALSHKTSYKYDRFVTLSPHVFRLRPAVHSRTPVLAYSLKVKPEKHFINWQQDPFGNFLGRVVFLEPTDHMSFDVEVIADLTVINPFDFFIEDYAAKFPFEYDEQLKKELLPYLEINEKGPLLMEWVAQFKDIKHLNMVDFLVKINGDLYKAINYTIRLETGVQTCEETLGKSLGSCRDSAYVLVQALRHLGLAARFVSGYLVQLSADQKAVDGPSGPEEDFTDLHAWAEVYVPGAGWIGLDATSGLLTSEGHIPLACTPDPASAAPVTGYSSKCEVLDFKFSNEVTRIHEDPRVSKPYSEEEWATAMGLGRLVDNYLDANDVRMTMGGEPTFVSVDDMESAQWNSTADGAHKRYLGGELAIRLRDQLAEGGLLHYGQGKWYPGEPLPRWQISLYWRKDGLNIWNNPNLIAEDKRNYDLTPKHAALFTKKLANYLGVNENNAMPAYEDIIYFLWEEGRLPVNLDPLKYNLKDPLERKRLMELLTDGLDKPVGFVLPLEWNYWNNRWLSCAWELRRQHLFLIPGNSPIGLRLPLDSLPYMSLNKREKVERSPFEDLPDLEDYHSKVKSRINEEIDETIPEQMMTKKKVVDDGEEEDEVKFGKQQLKTKKAQEEETAKEPEPLFEVFTIRTSLCVEVRDGMLYVFMPPLHYLEHYLDLLASIEATAADLKIPVRIEGYEPPKDNRLTKLMVTPDPGVLEINVHPAKSWNDLVNNYDILYEQARLSKLGSEKFMLDGRHTGTGGGNHITIGGDVPANSPILRRPDILRSLITYWQHHPGLSYLFATSFIGPTSQAPRVDEGRQEILYELEIAFEQIPEEGEVPFWLVDRIFRNLLIDVTGNTHRAEFCIDKLYSPDSSSGRLGILEFRGFDMPPHKHMCLIQLLLIRTLIARFWKEPYKHKLVRWGTELHDKFLMEHFVREDMQSVVDDLADHGFPFQMSWLEPFFEFRFPFYGKIDVGTIRMELSMAIEPWNVLGEEMGSSGTARFVDSSVEKVQVKVTGFTEERYAITCNGVRVPLISTGTKGQYVAGVKYKAWSPPSAMHPTIGVDVPLVFDIIDTWNSRSIGGCTYYVAHPGGRAYEAFPVNSYEAEGRRISRFWNEGFTPEALPPQQAYQAVERYLMPNETPVLYDIVKPVIDKEHPHTLDLRKFWKA
jgi:uncharacterized protein (DUF2126 family)/transglutaminase-like putative cysteine protease